MEFKKINMALVITVIVLFTVSIFTFLKVLFSDAKTLEWGSISDYISSISSFGTLLVAYFAYKAAPQWIHQKQNEEGFNHVSNMLKDYDAIVLNLRNVYFDILSVGKIKNEIDITTQKINKEMNVFFNLENKLKACKRWRIKSPIEVEVYFSQIKNFYDIALQLLVSYHGGDIDKIAEKQILLTNKINDILVNNDYFHKKIEEIFEFPN